MTIKENEETGTEQELGEEAGFNAQVDSLVPESSGNPMEAETDIIDDISAKSDDELEQEADEVVAAAEMFLGDMTAEEVLEKIQGMDGLEDAVFEKVSQKVFGKFGEIGQSLKTLQEREFTFDPEKLVKLREVDEGIAGALAEDLATAFQGQSFDSDAAIENIQKSVMANLQPHMEQRLLAALVPNVDEVVKTDEFSTWFFKEAEQDVRDTFQAWDEKTQMDGVAMARAFGDFETWKDAQDTEQASKKDSLNKSVEGKETSSNRPAARRHMTEDEAFAARTEEG